jgi:uncharacterized membrane protein
LDDKLMVRRGAAAWRLADLLIRQSVADAATVDSEIGVHPQNAQRVIAPLAEAGILTEFTGFTRKQDVAVTTVALAASACDWS